MRRHTPLLGREHGEVGGAILTQVHVVDLARHLVEMTGGLQTEGSPTIIMLSSNNSYYISDGKKMNLRSLACMLAISIVPGATLRNGRGGERERPTPKVPPMDARLITFESHIVCYMLIPY